jgi:hypothetical protein
VYITYIHIAFLFFLFKKVGSCYVTQAGLELLDSSSPLASVSSAEALLFSLGPEPSPGLRDPTIQPSMVVHACNYRTRETEVGDHEFQVSLGYTVKKPTKQTKILQGCHIIGAHLTSLPFILISA